MRKHKNLLPEIKPLWSLPNQNEFEFTGIMKDGAEIDCVVRKSFEGQYLAFSKTTGHRIFDKIKGWVEK